MTIFITPQNPTFQMEALTTYNSKNECIDAVRRASIIEMPVVRQFICLKIRYVKDTKGSDV